MNDSHLRQGWCFNRNNNSNDDFTRRLQEIISEEMRSRKEVIAFIPRLLFEY